VYHEVGFPSQCTNTLTLAFTCAAKGLTCCHCMCKAVLQAPFNGVTSCHSVSVLVLYIGHPMLADVAAGWFAVAGPPAVVLARSSDPLLASVDWLSPHGIVLSVGACVRRRRGDVLVCAEEGVLVSSTHKACTCYADICLCGLCTTFSKATVTASRSAAPHNPGGMPCLDVLHITAQPCFQPCFHVKPSYRVVSVRQCAIYHGMTHLQE